MLTQLLPSTLSLPPPTTKLPFLRSFPTRTHFHTHLSPWSPPRTLLLPPIRMGGGPRTYPGGVSKWQWKRMQAKKAKQLLKARLLRERQVYEMRKRAELKAAVSDLERPWELVGRAPALLSVSADEQVKVLADRFQRPGGFDMWSDHDGPQVFKGRGDGDDGSVLPSQRFFPKGVVHSVRPYGLVGDGDGGENGEDEAGFDDWIARGGGPVRRRRRRRRKECKEDVRQNADEKGVGGSGCIDVEARWVGDECGGESENGQLGLKNDSYGSNSKGNGKSLSGGRWRGSRRQVGGGGAKITLRPTSGLNSDVGGDRVRDYKRNDGIGFRRNRERGL